MKTLHISEPNEKQWLFLRDTHSYVAYGGARGGGKSWAVQSKAYILALNCPGIHELIVRRTYSELERNHIRTMKSALHGIAKYNQQRKSFEFPNGSVIEFGYVDNDGDMDQYQGQEYDVIFIDEAGQLKEEWIKKFIPCVRGTNGFPKRTYYTLNPGGPSHGYFKRLFVDRIFEEGENPDEYSMIQATVHDNYALMQAQPGYVAYLQSLPKYLRDMWLEGKWDIYQGQFFEEFSNKPDHYVDRLWTHVIEPFEIPRDWRVYRSYDFGYEKPFSCAWWAVDYDGVLYRILELYGCVPNSPNVGLKWTPDQQFEEIARLEREHPWLAGKQILGVADPAIWDKSRGESIYETALKHGVYFDKGDNRRIPGWMQVHYRLAFDDNGYPQMYVFSNCKGFIRTMPLLMFDQHRPEDLDTTMEDHIADEVRYMCMARPIPARETKKQEVIFSDPLNQFSGRRRRDDIRRMM